MLTTTRRSLLAALAGALALAGCSGGGGDSPVSKSLVVSITPASARIPVGPYSLALTLVVPPEVTEGEALWSIDGAGIGSPAVGYLGEDPDPMVVRYWPPAAVPTPDVITVRVVVRSPGYREASATCTIQIVPPVSVAVAPDPGSVRVGETLQFTAVVTGTAEHEVEWTVEGGPSQGTVDAGGLYTAPAMRPDLPVAIRARSRAFPMVSGTAAVEVQLKLTVTPAEVSLEFGGTQQFVATVEGTLNTGVIWSAEQGSITAQGLYVALADPRSDDVVHVRANADGNIVGQIKIHLLPPPAIITSLSGPAAPQETLVIRGSGFVGVPELHMPMVGSPTLSLVPELVSGTEMRVTVPAGCASGLVSVTMWHGQLAPTSSNAVPFTRLPRLRLRAPQRDLAAGESVSLQVAFLGADPLPLTWSADVGSVDAGTFRAPPDLGTDGFARVTACIAGTAVCDTAVLGLHVFRIEPSAGLVRPGETITLSAVGASGPTAATWQVLSGGGSFGGDGRYTASSLVADAGPVVVAATAGSVVEQAPLGVGGAFPGLVARANDYADFRNAPVQDAAWFSSTLAVQGVRAYVVTGGLLWGSYSWIDAYDVADPTSPRWLGAAENSGVQADKAFTAGGHLYVISSKALGGSWALWMSLYDLSSGVPRLLVQDWTHDWSVLALDGDLLYALDAPPPDSVPAPRRGLRVYDTRVGSLSPVRHVSLPVPAGLTNIYSMVVKGDRLYGSFYPGSASTWALLIFDISGAEGRLITTIEDGTWWAYLRTAGGYLFAGSEESWIAAEPTRVFDLSGEVPSLVSSIPSMSVVAARGTKVLGVGLWSGLHIVDLADPAQPRMVARVLTSSSGVASTAAWAGDAVLAAEGYGGLATYDVSAPGGPLEAGSFGGWVNMRYGWLVRGATMFESMSNQGGTGTRIFDLDQDPPAEIGRVDGLVAGVLEAGAGQLYAGRYSDLQVWDVTNLAAPVLVATLPIPAALLRLAGGVLYVASLDYSVSLKELVALDVSVPGVPKRLGSVPLEFNPVALASAGSWLLAVGYSNGINELFVFDVSDPAVPVLASRLDLGAQLFDVEADGSTAYLATSAGLAVVDVSDPTTPLVRAVACPPDDYAVHSGGLPNCTVRHVVVADDLVWSFGNRAVAWDVRDRSWPRVVSTGTFSGDAVELRWPWLYMAQVGYSASLPIFRTDVSRPRNVVHLLYPPQALQVP